MTSNDIVERKDLKKDEIIELPPELNTLITTSKRKKFLFPSAEKTIKDVDIFYFLDKKNHENISSISSRYLVAEFTLNYLKIINDVIEKKYRFPQLTLIDFTDANKIEEIRQRITELENEPIIRWLREKCLSELKDTVDNIDVNNINELNKLGQIINLLEKELSYRKKDTDTEIYDIFYKYLSRLDNLELTGTKHESACEVASIRKISKGEITEIRLECNKSDKSSRRQFEEFVIKAGKEIMSK